MKHEENRIVVGISYSVGRLREGRAEDGGKDAVVSWRSAWPIWTCVSPMSRRSRGFGRRRNCLDWFVCGVFLTCRDFFFRCGYGAWCVAFRCQLWVRQCSRDVTASSSYDAQREDYFVSSVSGHIWVDDKRRAEI